MPLDQAGPALIARDNMEVRVFMAIKRVKRANRPSCQHQQMFWESHDDIVIVYEQRDVSLKHITPEVHFRASRSRQSAYR